MSWPGTWCGSFNPGADVVQIFDSWAGGLPEHYFLEWVVKPNKRVVDGVRKVFPHAPIIGFPRAATQQGYEAYAKATGVNGLSIDTAASMRWAATSLGGKVALQGNLDPIALIAGGADLGLRHRPHFKRYGRYPTDLQSRPRSAARNATGSRGQGGRRASGVRA